VTPVDDPGTLARGIELDLERYRTMAAARPLPAIVADTAEILRHVSVRLREADLRAETVQLDWDIVHLIDAFRAALLVEARDRDN
jgi:hypothetical protein